MFQKICLKGLDEITNENTEITLNVNETHFLFEGTSEYFSEILSVYLF